MEFKNIDIDDDFIVDLAKTISDIESNPGSINWERVKAVKDSYNILRRIVDGKNVSVSGELFEPIKSAGSVTAKGRMISINSPDEFLQVADKSDNFEVYSTTNNKVIFNFTFHGLVR